MTHPNIIPALRYRDASTAIEWLCTNLGFKKRVVFESDGVVHHAQLTHGTGMIMIGTRRESPYDQLTKMPLDIDQYNTQSPYIFVEDLEKHYAQSLKKGVDIVLQLNKEAHGSGYTCRDPEGHLWNFGDFNPWQQPTEI